MKKTVLSVFLVLALLSFGERIHAAGMITDGCTGGVVTAFGCFQPGAEGSYIQTFLNLGFGIAGGVAFLLILVGGLQIMTSSGNPEKLNAGKEVVISAIVGLLFILFSVFILQLIGVKILQLPGFS